MGLPAAGCVVGYCYRATVCISVLCCVFYVFFGMLPYLFLTVVPSVSDTDFVFFASIFQAAVSVLSTIVTSALWIPRIIKLVYRSEALGFQNSNLQGMI